MHSSSLPSHNTCFSPTVSPAWQTQLQDQSCWCADSLVEAQEMVLSSRGQPSQRIALKPVTRPIGQNDVGIVAWTMTLKSPECPTGRRVASHMTFLRVLVSRRGCCSLAHGDWVAAVQGKGGRWPQGSFSGSFSGLWSCFKSRLGAAGGPMG